MPGKDHPDDVLRIALEAKARYGAQLMAHPDVHAVGVGRRRRQGRKTDEYAVVVHLRRKLPLTQVPIARQLPTTLRFGQSEHGQYLDHERRLGGIRDH